CDNFSTRLAQWPSGPVAQWLSGSVFELADHDAGVVPAEAERVRDADGDVGLPRLVRDVVEIALGVLLLVVDRRGQQAAFDGEHGEDGLDGARGAEAVAGRALRRRNADLRRVLLAQRLLDHLRLARVTERSRRRVRVHV